MEDQEKSNYTSLSDTIKYILPDMRLATFKMQTSVKWFLGAMCILGVVMFVLEIIYKDYREEGLFGVFIFLMACFSFMIHSSISDTREEVLRWHECLQRALEDDGYKEEPDAKFPL